MNNSPALDDLYRLITDSYMKYCIQNFKDMIPIMGVSRLFRITMEQNLRRRAKKLVLRNYENYAVLELMYKYDDIIISHEERKTFMYDWIAYIISFLAKINVQLTCLDLQNFSPDRSEIANNVWNQISKLKGYNQLMIHESEEIGDQLAEQYNKDSLLNLPGRCFPFIVRYSVQHKLTIKYKELHISAKFLRSVFEAIREELGGEPYIFEVDCRFDELVTMCSGRIKVSRLTVNDANIHPISRRHFFVLCRNWNVDELHFESNDNRTDFSYDLAFATEFGSLERPIDLWPELDESERLSVKSLHLTSQHALCDQKFKNLAVNIPKWFKCEDNLILEFRFTLDWKDITTQIEMMRPIFAQTLQSAKFCIKLPISLPQEFDIVREVKDLDIKQREWKALLTPEFVKIHMSYLNYGYDKCRYEFFPTGSDKIIFNVTGFNKNMTFELNVIRPIL